MAKQELFFPEVAQTATDAHFEAYYGILEEIRAVNRQIREHQGGSSDPNQKLDIGENYKKAISSQRIIEYILLEFDQPARFPHTRENIKAKR